MSGIGVHSFEVPHEHVRPTRDMVIIRLPRPPSKIGSIITPNVSRDMMQHNVMAGIVAAMGPLAFKYKDGTGPDGKGISGQEVKIGDWVLIRPFAGTMMQAGKLISTFGWRYVSSFNDVIGIIPAEHMPAADTLEWDSSEPTPQEVANAAAPAAEPVYVDSVRERTVYDGKRKQRG
jgi:hypothetical protein